LISILDQIGDVTSYLSGPAAKAYLEDTPFISRGITVEWIDYTKYSAYHQLFPPFEHGVTIIDVLLNSGLKRQNIFQ
jgi:hypothetical protein